MFGIVFVKCGVAAVCAAVFPPAEFVGISMALCARQILGHMRQNEPLEIDSTGCIVLGRPDPHLQ